jgi:TPR repeat protein
MNRKTSIFLRLLLPIAISAGSSTLAAGGFDEGVANYRAENYEGAFKEWTEAAEQGDADAQYNLGCLFLRGEGTTPDRARAREWFRKAADQDESDSMSWLFTTGGGMETEEERKAFFSKKLPPSRRFHLTFVAELENGNLMRWPCSTDEKNGAEKQFKIGLMYDSGKMGLPQNDKQAAAWYRKAAERDFAVAQTKLAYMYAAGRGVERNWTEAGKLLRRSAALGDTVAQDNVGAMYEKGIYGVMQNLVMAYVMYSHAAAAGNKLSVASLAELKARLDPSQLREGEMLAEKWKGNEPLPAEIAARLRSKY